jgi:site-specific DNA-methyltransferase (adenine-specific)
MNQKYYEMEPIETELEPTRTFTGRSTIRMYNADCMDLMATGRKWDLAIVDPEYGIDAGNMTMGKGKNKKYHKSDWDKNIPNESYFRRLEDVSDKSIIWGGNYFTKHLRPTGGWIFWDKLRDKDVSFSDGELAWTSFLNTLKKIPIRYDGFIGADLIRIHPTQKPVKLYKWLLHNYAKTGDTILDTHGGSMSLAIACWDMGFDLDICELDKDYFDAAVKRFENHIAQQEIVFPD